MRSITFTLTAPGATTGAWIPMDIYTPSALVTVSATLVSGSVTYSVQFTNEDPFDTSITQTAVAHPATALTSATASQTASNHVTSSAGTPAMVPMRAVRVNTASGTGTLRVTIVQQSTA